MNAKFRERPRTILLLLPTAYQDGMDKFDGIHQYVTERKLDWRLRLVRLSVDDHFTAATFADVDGVIMNRTSGLSLCRKAAAGRRPVVAIDWYAPDIVSNRRQCCRILADNVSIGRAAADVILDCGLFVSYACLPDAHSLEWSTIRQKAFARELLGKGRKCVVLDHAHRLDKQLLALERPTVVFAVNDALAAQMLTAADAAGLKVPQDLSVLGVDNERISCLTTNPPLSSIRPDFVRAGYLAAQTLDGLLRGEKTPRLQLYPITDIIHRSSMVPPGTAARIVQSAKAIVRDSPAASDVDVIASQIGVSRRLLDIRFRELEGMSVLDCIQHNRIGILKTRLRTTTQSIGEICKTCGFGSGTYPLQLFKRLTGMTMREYRNQAGKTDPRRHP